MRNMTAVDQVPEVLISGTGVPAGPETIAMLSTLFFFIGTVGVVGNTAVINIILSDANMFKSPTNVLIANLAISDLLITFACIPDIIMFMNNGGWSWGLCLCRIIRFVQVSALFSSVMTLVSVCVERYIAIVHPMMAHIVCHRERIVTLTWLMWPLSMFLASPNLYQNVLKVVNDDFTPCVMEFPHPIYHISYKYIEFVLFYLIPLTIQIILYSRTSLVLFDTKTRKCIEPVSGKERVHHHIKMRKGVVKMLIAGVVMYFICFSPHQVLLLYETFSQNEPKFEDTWPFLIFTNIMAYASSAANPLLYSIFSQKFRKKLKNTLLCRHASRVIRLSFPSSVFFRDKTNRLNGTFHKKSFRTIITEV